MRGDFTLARIGRPSSKDWQAPGAGAGNGEAPMVCVRDFVREKGIETVTLLHSDIQGFEYEMLQGCGDLITSGDRVRIYFYPQPQGALPMSEVCDAQWVPIIAEHTPKESYSEDGLIVGAACPSTVPRVEISKKPVSVRQAFKAAVFRLLA